MWPYLLAVLALVALCVLGLGVNVLFLGREFPKYDVGSNEQMRRLGIRCFKDEDAALHGRSCVGTPSDACRDCQFYNPHAGSDPAPHPGLDPSPHPGLDPGSKTD